MRILKKMLISTALLGIATLAYSAELAGVPMKDHHMKIFGSAMKCEMCHQQALPTSKPSDKMCIQCHGTMDKIATKPNPFDKNPHASAHYGNTLECTACHAEHKPSKDLCSNCHRVQWNNFK